MRTNAWCLNQCIKTSNPFLLNFAVVCQSRKSCKFLIFKMEFRGTEMGEDLRLIQALLSSAITKQHANRDPNFLFFFGGNNRDPTYNCISFGV